MPRPEVPLRSADRILIQPLRTFVILRLRRRKDLQVPARLIYAKALSPVISCPRISPWIS
jgi:hypothetical protein